MTAKPAHSDSGVLRLRSSEAEGTGEALLELIASAPRRRVVAGITGAGRSGKSTLLAEVADRWRAAGLVVGSAPAGVTEIDGVLIDGVLIDDAHDLPDATLAQLCDLVENPGPSVVVAYRARADGPALRRLARLLERHNPPAVLGPLDRHGLAAAALRDGAPASPVFLEELEDVTGGLPWLVHRVLTANPHRTVTPVAPWQVADRLGYELAELPADQQELLLVLSLGFDAAASGSAAVALGAASLDRLVDEVRDAGLLLPNGRVVPLIRDAVTRSTPLHRMRAAQRHLIDVLSESGLALERVGRTLARTGLQDARVAGCLTSAGDHLLETRPEAAAALYADALGAGADEAELAARRGQAEWGAGNPDAAWRALAPALTTPDAEQARRATDVAAALWAERGMLSGAADAYRWRGPETVGSSAPLAAVALYGVGDREAAEAMLGSAPARSAPMLTSVALRLVADGIRDSVGPEPSRALSTLVRASDLFTSSGLTLPLPVLPAQLAATLALGSGELRTAETVLDAAITGRQGGGAGRPALLLTRAWVAMLADQPDRAREAMEGAGETGPLPSRDELVRRALDVALARRADDAPALLRSWQAARDAVLHVAVDLYSLLPLGELMVAAARLRDSAHLDYQVDAASALLGRLGDPPLWSAPLHWSGVQAAILAERPAQLAGHAAALVAGADRSRLAAVLADASRAWLSVLRGGFRTSAVEASARSLATAGLTWDGSRLAGHAAAHAEDRRDMARLLACARDLHGVQIPAPAESPREARARSDGRGETLLSSREREVARLLLAGRNYREIGEAIFISPRTVEHHIARIRQRLSAQSRSDLLTQLRVALDEDRADAGHTP